MMLYDKGAPRRSVNLTLNADLVSRVRAKGHKISAVAEAALEAVLAREAQEAFLAEVRRGVELSEAMLDEHGDFAAAALAQYGVPYVE